MMDEKPVWIPDAEEGYVLGKIVDIGQDQVTALTLAHPSKVLTQSRGSSGINGMNGLNALLATECADSVQLGVRFGG